MIAQLSESDRSYLAEQDHQNACAEQAYQALIADGRGSGRTYFHFITLIKRSTGEEASMTVETDTERFKDVLDAITFQKVERGLFGYEIFEVIPSEPPF